METFQNMQTAATEVDNSSHNLYESIKVTVEKHLANLGSENSNDLYDIVLAEIERPFFEAVLKHTKGNQSKAAIILGLSRGTLRKKLKQHGFLD